MTRSERRNARAGVLAASRGWSGPNSFQAFFSAVSSEPPPARVSMVGRYGAVSVTAVGMFGNDALWFVPLGGATVLVTVGSIVERVKIVDGTPEAREHLCLTVSFDHAIVDGAPAARFVKRLSELHP